MSSTLPTHTLEEWNCPWAKHLPTPPPVIGMPVQHNCSTEINSVIATQNPALLYTSTIPVMKAPLLSNSKLPPIPPSLTNHVTHHPDSLLNKLGKISVLISELVKFHGFTSIVHSIQGHSFITTPPFLHFANPILQNIVTIGVSVTVNKYQLIHEHNY